MEIIERNKIIEENLSYIYKIAYWVNNKSNKCKLEIDELVSYGVIGAIKAIEKFDETKGKKFSSYLYLRVKSEMIDGIRKSSRVPRPLMKRISQYYKLKAELNRKPFRQELSEELKIKGKILDNFLVRLNQWEQIISFNSKIKNTEGEIELQETIVDCNLEYEAKIINHELLSHGLKRLNQNEIGILWLYFQEGLLFEEIAAIRGCSRSNISNIKNKAIKKLREFYAC